MTGTVKNVLAQKNFGFIRGDKGEEYFFHREDFNGHWADLEGDVSHGGQTVIVEFEPIDTPKGKRAAKVHRTDFPNEANVEYRG